MCQEWWKCAVDYVPTSSYFCWMYRWAKRSSWSCSLHAQCCCSTPVVLLLLLPLHSWWLA